MMRGKVEFVAGAAVGTVATLLADPREGRRRRAALNARAGALVRRARRQGQRRARYLEGKAQGAAARAARRGGFRPADDQALATHLHEVLEGLDVPTRDINVEVVERDVRLRGEVRGSEDRNERLRAIERQPGVARVESLLHLPGEPAPNKADALRA